MDRVLANRRSARDSRERRKKLVENLEASVESLTEANTILSRENKKLNEENSKLLSIFMRRRLEQQQTLRVALRPTMNHFTNTIAGVLDHNSRKTSPQVAIQSALLQNPMRALNQASLIQLPLTQVPIQPIFPLIPHREVVSSFNSIPMAAASTQPTQANTNVNGLSCYLLRHLM